MVAFYNQAEPCNMYINLCPLVDIETFQWNTSLVVYGMIDERLVIKDELQ